MLNEASAHFYKQFLIIKKRYGDMAMIFVYPLISIFSLGIFAFFIISRGSPPEAMLFVLVGVIVWDIFNAAMRYGSYSLMLDIWNDCLKHSFAGSSSLAGYIIGNGMFGVFMSTMIFLVMSGVGYAVFGFLIIEAGLFLLNFIPVFLFGMSAGLVVAAAMLLKGEKWMSFNWILPGILLLFSGIYYPVDLLPSPLYEFTLMLPSTHSLISLRSGMGFQPGMAIPEFWIGLILSIIYFTAGTLLFKYSINKAKETGMMVRY